MITRAFTATVIRIDNRWASNPIEVDLDWHDDDAATVSMHWTEEGRETVTWVVSRELLAQGVESDDMQGEGDFRLRRTYQPSAGVLVCLQSDEGHADVRLPYQPVRDFLDETSKVTPIGSESYADDIEAFLKEVLDGE